MDSRSQFESHEGRLHHNVAESVASRQAEHLVPQEGRAADMDPEDAGAPKAAAVEGLYPEVQDCPYKVVDVLRIHLAEIPEVVRAHEGTRGGLHGCKVQLAAAGDEVLVLPVSGGEPVRKNPVRTATYMVCAELAFIDVPECTPPYMLLGVLAI